MGVLVTSSLTVYVCGVGYVRNKQLMILKIFLFFFFFFFFFQEWKFLWDSNAIMNFLNGKNLNPFVHIWMTCLRVFWIPYPASTSTTCHHCCHCHFFNHFVCNCAAAGRRFHWYSLINSKEIWVSKNSFSYLNSFLFFFFFFTMLKSLLS